MKRFSKFIQEAKLSQSQRDRLDDLILNVHMTTHPEYDGDEEPTKYLNMIRKEFGDKVANKSMMVWTKCIGEEIIILLVQISCHGEKVMLESLSLER